MIIKEITDRRAIRNYASDEVSEDDLLEIIKAAQFAPTGMNNRAVEFVVVRDQEIKNKIFDVLEPKQDFIQKAPVLIIPTTNMEKSVVSVEDLAIASSFIMLQARALGLGTVWKHLSNPEEVAKILGLPENYKLINLIPVGKASEELPPHTEKELSQDKIHFDKW